MGLLCNLEDVKNATWKAKLPYLCDFCKKKFFRTKAVFAIAKRKGWKFTFCSRKCQVTSHCTKISAVCEQCKKKLKRRQLEIERSKHLFCTSSCAATFNNTHKRTGTRRSKLEKWLESELIAHFTELEIHFNRKDAINSELDIFIPKLKLAFELNGIYHYEPIHGEKLLTKIQNNDSRKFQACLENKIELVLIDSSGLAYFKPAKAQKYLDIITKVITLKLESEIGTAPIK